MYTVIWLENPKGRDHLEDADIDGDNIRTDLGETAESGRLDASD
jgi:hypothetical protein